MAMVPPGQREAFVRELTRTTVEAFFEARGIDTGGAEFSYVMHHRMSEDTAVTGQHNPHSHVVLPGTISMTSSASACRCTLRSNRKVDHIAMLHAVTEQNRWKTMMERYVGPDWEQRYDALQANRDQQKPSLT